MPHKDPEKKKAYSKAHYEAKKEKKLAKQKAYREANKDEIKAQKKAWCDANKEKIKAYDKAYRKSNPERRKAICKKYYEANSAKYIERATFRKKLLNKLQRPSWYNSKLVNKIYNECHKLNKIAGFIKYHVDHIVPLQGKNVSGLHVQDNLEIILASANLSKSNKFET